MRILIATDSMDIGGAETHVFTLINELRKNNEVTLISSGGVYFTILEKSGIKCVYAPFNKRDALSVVKSKKALNKEMKRADIVHTHTRFTSFLAKKIRGKNSYPKIVTTAHLNFPLFPFGRFAYWGDGTLAVSEDIRDYLSNNYQIKKDKIHLTKNSIDLGTYNKAALNKKLIIHTSRIDKGRARCAFLLVDAAIDILKEHKGWRIMIVGDGNLFPKLSKKVNATNSALGFEGVILSGARSDIPALLAYGSIFVGVSRSALEGMACGLPTIICGDEGYGGMVDNDNFSLLSYANFCARGLDLPTKEALMNDIDYLICNPHLRRELGEFARKSIELFYQSQSMANDALLCYRSVAKKPSVCLMGFFGHQNLGDEETLASAIKVLSSLGIKDISVLSTARGEKKFEFTPIKIYDRMSPTELISAIDGSDVFILCGGNLMQNETSLRSLMYYEQAIQLAKRRGKRVYILSSGFGEIRGSIAKFLLRRGIKSADFCGCRTQSDLETAKQYKSSPVIMPDFCFLLPEAEKKEKKKTTFAWIISSKEDVTLDDIREISHERSLVPVAVNLFKENDLKSEKKIRDAGIRVITPKSYAELSEILANAEFSVSERLHGSIFSILTHTPTYITVRSTKNRAMINEISLRKSENDIIFPYSRNAVISKKEIGAQDSDFNYVINSLKRDIESALTQIF